MDYSSKSRVGRLKWQKYSKVAQRRSCRKEHDTYKSSSRFFSGALKFLSPWQAETENTKVVAQAMEVRNSEALSYTSLGDIC